MRWSEGLLLRSRIIAKAASFVKNTRFQPYFAMQVGSGVFCLVFPTARGQNPSTIFRCSTQPAGNCRRLTHSVVKQPLRPGREHMARGKPARPSAGRIQPVYDLRKVGERPGQPVDLGGEDPAHKIGLDIREQALQRAPGQPAVIAAGRHQRPALGLSIERGEVLIEPPSDDLRV